jgi:hypothetical protein
MREKHRSDDPDAIERDLRRTRAEVDRTIDEIQERLSPGQLIDEGLRYLRNGPSDYLATFGSNLGASVRDNPLPVAMIGLGVAWLAFGQRADAGGSTYRGQYDRSWTAGGYGEQSESMADRARAAGARLQRRADETEAAFEHRRQQAMAKVLEVRDQVGESTDQLKQRVAAAMDEASARWEELKANVRDRSHDIRDSAADGMARARDAVGAGWSSAGRTSDKALEIFEQQPLLAAAAGVTLGALLGSLLPPTQREAEVLGPHRDELKRQARAVGEEALETTKRAGRAAADAALHEVDRTMDDVDQTAERQSATAERDRHGPGNDDLPNRAAPNQPRV